MAKVTLQYETPRVKADLYFPALHISDSNQFSQLQCEVAEITTHCDNPEYYIMPCITNKYSAKIGIKLDMDEAVCWKLGIMPLSEIFKQRRHWFRFIFANSGNLMFDAITSPQEISLEIIPQRKPDKSYINKIPLNANRND